MTENHAPKPYALRKLLRYRGLTDDELTARLVDRAPEVLENDEALELIERVAEIDNSAVTYTMLVMLLYRLDDLEMLMVYIDSLVADEDSAPDAVDEVSAKLAERGPDATLRYSAAAMAATLEEDPVLNIWNGENLRMMVELMQRHFHHIEPRHEDKMLQVGLAAAAAELDALDGVDDADR